ncbi:EcoRII N-terminal effector-binding domain-containing protein [Pedobacter sp. MR2016-24]|uniref:EcoRII N-terminal effector-binding domain-containing protein n=1 Tax=Pedobacter sp. MR2016-24 TaxID=2994466 RepID=UPI002245A685|nr:EcoRII N-terminal effector-binding domain-containing protein [Pedobacter sp. MR2016-24]MCX2483265.1 ATP-binding protein [Pedobacter sp. MR2016-24]
MTNEVSAAVSAVNANVYSFCKFISPNDAGTTGAHQAGLYIPKNSISLVFNQPGIHGQNKEKFATIVWSDNITSRCRFIYYGQGTRDEYRVTRLGRSFNVDDLVVLVKEDEENYLGFLLRSAQDKSIFLDQFQMSDDDTNKLIDKSLFVGSFSSEPQELAPPATDTRTIVPQLNNDLTQNHSINFRPKAHILILLGEELIKSPVMAIYELIKNGYDADAKSIHVTFHNIDRIDDAVIEITDSGTGITADVLENVWFEPGTDFRKPVNIDGVRTIKRSPMFNRIPMGEKGVGRFAVHKLGNRIKLVSRPARVIQDADGKFVRTELLDYEITVSIDWRRFSQSRYLDDVGIEWTMNSDPATFLFKDSHGTFIQVASLKEEWTRGMARQLKKQTLSMVSPKNDPSKFRIELDFGNWWLNNIPETSSLLELAPYKVTAFVDKDYNMTFDYEFRLANNNEIGSRIIDNKLPSSELEHYEHNIRGEVIPYLRESLEEQEYENPVIENIVAEFDAAELPFGNLMLEMYSYDLDSMSLRDVTNSPKNIRDLLRDHHGIKVFKGDLRVYDYGDPGNDWLGLDIKRVNNKEWFSNNQIIGYVYLDPETSGPLIEKTNREGFIHNAAYANFVVVLEYILTAFKAERFHDRQRWLKFNQKGTGGNTFADRLQNFRGLISGSGLDATNQALLLEEANRVGEKYNEDRDALLIPAGVGMTASFAMHEIEKLIPRMQESVAEDPVNKFRITSQVSELKDYSEGLLSVLRKGGAVNMPAVQVVKTAVGNYNSRLQSWKIDVSITPGGDDTIMLKADRRLIVTVLMNLIDNSLYWLDTVYKDFKGIFIKITKIENGVSILVVDNGPGFKETVGDIVTPYYTRKRNGIGIGMYLVDTIMINYGRLNIITDREELSGREVPEIYTGAAVELIFNKNQ